MNRKTIFITLSLTLLLALGITVAVAQEPLDTAFSYQGRLDDGGSPANGSYEFEFKLFDAATAGSQVGSTVTQTVTVTDGLFLLGLDFGSDAFNGQNRYLEVGVRPAGSSDPYTMFMERQKLTATPYALYASRAPWSGLLGIPPELADGLDDDTLAGLNCLNGQVAKWDGAAWLCADDLAEPGGLHTHHTLAAIDGDPTEAVFVDENGKVGIGTITPTHSLDVISNEANIASIRASNTADGIDLIVGGTSDTNDDGVISSDPSYVGSDLLFQSNNDVSIILNQDNDNLETGVFRIFEGDRTEIFRVDDRGNVGINTNAPGARLDIISPSDGNTNIPALRVSNNRIYGSDLILGGIENSDGGDDGVITSDPRFPGSDIVLSSQDAVIFLLDEDNNETGQFEIKGNNHVWFRVAEEGATVFASGAGIGRHDATMRVDNSQTAGGMAGYYTNKSANHTAHFANSGTGGVFYLQSNGGNFIQAMSHDETEVRFQVDYDGTTRTRVLQITGGADLSEQFDIRTSEADLQPEPGMVACIDSDHIGQLILCHQAYDRTVAGIISGAGGVNTGMLMGQTDSEADGKYPVALTGRVYVWADADLASIQPGDLLTTANTLGHAMKVTDPSQAQGAILGKAMSGLAEGQGLVLVLVGLQ